MDTTFLPSHAPTIRTHDAAEVVPTAIAPATVWP
jgi:hypothetical protein